MFSEFGRVSVFCVSELCGVVSVSSHGLMSLWAVTTVLKHAS